MAQDGNAEKIIEICKRRGISLATAESCTGGMLASALINVPGASDVFSEGYITYSNESKRRVLGVSDKTLLAHGAVSRQTAEEMARGCAAVSGADVALSITGIAGPGGGSEKKPVGLVYIACGAGDDVRSGKYRFSGSRTQVREASAHSALEMLLERIEESRTEA